MQQLGGGMESVHADLTGRPEQAIVDLVADLDEVDRNAGARK